MQAEFVLAPEMKGYASGNSNHRCKQTIINFEHFHSHLQDYLCSIRNNYNDQGTLVDSMLC